MALPTNIDASYPDRDAGDALHQQHHDTVHGILNDPATYWTAGNAAYMRGDNGAFVWDITKNGVVGDGTNEGPALQAVLDACSAAGGGWVYHPDVDVYTAQQIVIPNNVVYFGRGGRVSKLYALTGFPAATALVRLGQGLGIVFGCRIEDIRVECNSIAAIGVYSNEAQEQSGVRNCVINGHTSKGVHFATGASIVGLEHVEVFGGSTATVGVHFEGVAGQSHIADVTVIGRPSAVGTNAPDGILVESSHVNVDGAHGEICDNVVRYAGLSGVGSAQNVHGHSSVTNLVKVDNTTSGGHTFAELVTNGATNALTDSLTGRTFAGNLGFYASSFGGSGVDKQVIHSSTTQPWRVNAPVALTGNVGFYGTAATAQPSGVTAEAALEALGLAASVVEPPKFISAAGFNLVGVGTPSLVGAGNSRFVGWGLDPAASEERLGGAVYIPTGWTTVNIDLIWSNNSTGVGDVVWRLLTQPATDAASINAHTNQQITATAPGQYIIKESRIATGLAVTAGDPLLVSVGRLGSSAADTHGTDAILVGVQITKAS